VGGAVKLSEAKIAFEMLKKEKIIIRKHAWLDHPERNFSVKELTVLIMGKGRLTLNKYPSAQTGSFLFLCVDELKRSVEIAILIEDNIIVIHAYRRIK
jgi:hypothetical protein